ARVRRLGESVARRAGLDQATLGPLEGGIRVVELAGLGEGAGPAQILEDAPDEIAVVGVTQEEMTALLAEPLMDLEEDPRARAVELVHPFQVEDHVPCAHFGSRLHAAGQPFGGAEEDGALELEDDDLPAALSQEIHELRMARAARSHRIPVVGPAHPRAA